MPHLTTSVLAVHRDGEHRFSKQAVDAITLQAGLGVVGDATWGTSVQHCSRVKANSQQPNLRQVHLISASLFAAMLGQTPQGQLLRKTGVMATVVQGGVVQAGDAIRVQHPSTPHRPIDRV